MDWAPIPTDFFRIPAVIHVGKDGGMIHMAAILYLYDQELLDGVLPVGVVRMLCPGIKQPERAVRTLLTKALPGETPLWQQVDGGYFLTDWDFWADRLAAALRKRDRETAKKRKARERRRNEGDVGTLKFPGGSS